MAAHGTLPKTEKCRCRKGNRDSKAGGRRQLGARTPKTAGVLKAPPTPAVASLLTGNKQALPTAAATAQRVRTPWNASRFFYVGEIRKCLSRRLLFLIHRFHLIARTCWR